MNTMTDFLTTFFLGAKSGITIDWRSTDFFLLFPLFAIAVCAANGTFKSKSVFVLSLISTCFYPIAILISHPNAYQTTYGIFGIGLYYFSTLSLLIPLIFSIWLVLRLAVFRWLSQKADRFINTIFCISILLTSVWLILRASMMILKSLEYHNTASSAGWIFGNIASNFLVILFVPALTGLLQSVLPARGQKYLVILTTAGFALTSITMIALNS